MQYIHSKSKNSSKKTHLRIFRRKLLCFLLAALFISGQGVVFTGDIVNAHVAASAPTSSVSFTFTALPSSAEGSRQVRIELWEGLKPGSGTGGSNEAFTSDTNQIPVIDGRAILSGAEEGDVFTYCVSAEGCYTVICSFALSKQDILLQEKQIKINLQKRAGNGYEASQVRIWSEEIEEKLFSTDTLNDVDTGILDTPAFDSGKAAHAFTTLAEGTAYLKQLCAGSSHAWLYYLDSGKTWPVVIFTKTDLRGITSLEKALSAISKNNRVKVLYQAQIHGNEPAAGEGALTVAKALAGQTDAAQCLDQLDVVMVPYANRYGAAHFVRTGTAGGVNLNRDALALRAAATKTLHKLFVDLMPEVFIDGHEFSFQNKIETRDDSGVYLEWLDDIQLTCVNNLNREPGIFEHEEAMAAETRQALRSKGFRTYAYDASCNSTTGCNFARLYNSYAFLVETGGIGMGKAHFDRRVLSQYETVTSLLGQLSANRDSVRTNVAKARKALRRRGSKYAASDKFVLRHGSSGGVALTMERLSFDLLGEIWGDPQRTDTFFNADTALRQRSRPTAYLIDKGAPGAAKAKAVLTANGAKCYQLPKNTKVQVRQYSGDKTRAIVGKSKKKTFKKGAYVFAMDQNAANIISASLEPDTTDTAGYKGTFVQSGILKKSGGAYPIYRYEGSLKSLKKK